LLGMKSADGETADRLDVSRDGIIDQTDVSALKSILKGTSSSTEVYYDDDTSGLPTQEDRGYYVYSAKTGNKTSTYTLYAGDVSKITSTSASTRAILDGDDRELETSLKGVVNINNIATGFIVDSHTIVTAAHCLYTKSSDEVVSSCVLYLYDDSTGEVKYNNASVTATPVEFHIPAKYISSSSETVYKRYDYAVITVKEDLSDYVSFNLGVARSKAIDKTVSATGFGWNSDNEKYNKGINTSLIGKMSTGSGKIVSISSYRIGCDADTINGDSGGPLYYTDNGINTVVGIISTQMTSTNYCTRITTDILQFVYNNDNLGY
jgi:V8-like Glu-specific endopeptidase